MNLAKQSNPHHQWCSINQMIQPGTMSNRTDSIKYESRITNNDMETVEAFNEFFVSVGPNFASTMNSDPPHPLSVKDFFFFLKPSND